MQRNEYNKSDILKQNKIYMQKVLLLLLVTALSSSNCKKEKTNEIESLIPGDLTGLIVTNIPNGAKIDYKIPEQDKIVRILSSFESAGGEKKELSFDVSTNKTGITINGLKGGKKSTVTLRTVNAQGNKSMGVDVQIEPLVPGKDISGYLPKDYVTDGTVDYTEFLQTALMENSIFTFPNFPIAINYRGLQLQSNSKLFFQPESKLILIPSGARTYYMLDIDNKENVEIYDANLIGERNEVFDGKPRTGEWGMGIALRSAKNVKLINLTTTDTWGDGIYFGKSKQSDPRNTNEDITIVNPSINNAGRNGMSITNGKNVFINGGEIYNTRGKSPEAAIDIEPNGPSNDIENINIIDLKTRDNKNGMLISLRGMVSSVPKDVTINIINHTDIGTGVVFRFAGLNKTLDPNYVPLQGKIFIKNSTWENNKGLFTYEKTYNLFPKTIFDGITTIKTVSGERIVDGVTYATSLQGWLKIEPNFTVIP